MLIILSGLPGVGKTSIARELARQTDAIHLRIDSIELAIRASGFVDASLGDAGYRVAYAVAEDNLVLGRTVIADSVNPLPITRAAWRDVGHRARVRVLEVEVICSDAMEHRRRVEARVPEPHGPTLTWEDVVARDYRPWDRDRIVLDTASDTVDRLVQRLRRADGAVRVVALICYNAEMTKEVTLRQAGGSVSATLPKGMADRLRLEAGDRILAVETDRGILLTPFDPEAERALRVAARAAKKYRNALRELAK